MDGWMDGRMDGQMDGWMDDRLGVITVGELRLNHRILQNKMANSEFPGICVFHR